MEIQCEKVDLKCDLPCQAILQLDHIYQMLRTGERRDIIQKLRSMLDIQDYETADDLKEMADQIISRMPELQHILEFDIKIGYIRSYEAKYNKSKIVFGDCRKVSGLYQAYLPFDFLITFYEPNINHMSENQRKILMLHELKHVGIGERGLRIEPHDIEDFRSILSRYGMDWNGFSQEVPDILAGGDFEKRRRKKK